MTPKMFFWKVRARIATMFARLLPDDVYLKWIFPARVGYPLDLKTPKTFNEKLQWLKLHDRKPEYTKMVDKVEAKKYVASIIGDEYIIPTIAVYDSVEDIDFDALPQQFVLKCSHDSGGIVICRDKNKLDKKAAIAKLRKGLKQNFYWQNREWPYKNVKPRIIAEQYMEDTWKPNASLVDYKFYCFGGEPTYCQVIQDRDTTETIDFFDMDWQHQDFVGLNPAAGPAAGPAALCPQKPKNFDVMKKIAGDLSKEKPFSRIDLYEINDHTFFGEITFFPLSGFGVFSPEQYNEILGKLITMTGTGGG